MTALDEQLSTEADAVLDAFNGELINEAERDQALEAIATRGRAQTTILRTREIAHAVDENAV